MKLMIQTSSKLRARGGSRLVAISKGEFCFEDILQLVTCSLQLIENPEIFKSYICVPFSPLKSRFRPMFAIKQSHMFVSILIIKQNTKYGNKNSDYRREHD